MKNLFLSVYWVREAAPKLRFAFIQTQKRALAPPSASIQAYLVTKPSTFGRLMWPNESEARGVNCTVMMSSSRRVLCSNKKILDENRKKNRSLSLRRRPRRRFRRGQGRPTAVTVGRFWTVSGPFLRQNACFRGLLPRSMAQLQGQPSQDVRQHIPHGACSATHGYGAG